MKARTLALTRCLAAALSSAALVALVSLACSTPSPADRFVATAPDRASFDAVAPVLVRTCGTLDCHGTVARNFKIYGDTGLRFAPSDRPSVLTPTTVEEIDRTYQSLVGLEPEILSAVVASGGARPDRLTFLRKARGTEHHKPGAIIAEGDDRDVCFTTWLAGSTDAAACVRALGYP
jgi:hypothetical protein